MLTGSQSAIAISRSVSIDRYAARMWSLKPIGDSLLRPLAIYILGCTCCLALPIQAASFGIADARSQALGGTAVALGGTAEGFLYNPALTALHHGDEDLTHDGRTSYVVLVDGLSDGAQTAAEAITDDLEGELSNAITNLNNDTNSDTARAAAVAVQDLGRAMSDLEQQNIYADVYTGIHISVPGDGEGGAFFLGSRLMVVGDSNIEQADLDLLDDYLEALNFIDSGGTQGQQHPELIDANGQLINPSDNIQSSAAGSALLVTEAGISAAKQWRLWGQNMAFGVSPKVVYLRSFDERWGVEEGDFNNQSSKENLLYVNFDAGLAWTYNEHWRIGLAIKDAIAKRWTTSLGQTFNLKSKTRLGFAYSGESWRLGLDADLSKSNHLHSDLEVQIVSVGLEWQMLSNLALRSGYRMDLENTLGESTTLGLAARWNKAVFELSASTGKFDTGAALQFSWHH